MKVIQLNIRKEGKKSVNLEHLLITYQKREKVFSKPSASIDFAPIDWNLLNNQICFETIQSTWHFCTPLFVCNRSSFLAFACSHLVPNVLLLSIFRYFSIFFTWSPMLSCPQRAAGPFGQRLAITIVGNMEPQLIRKVKVKVVLIKIKIGNHHHE